MNVYAQLLEVIAVKSHHASKHHPHKDFIDAAHKAMESRDHLPEHVSKRFANSHHGPLQLHNHSYTRTEKDVKHTTHHGSVDVGNHLDNDERHDHNGRKARELHHIAQKHGFVKKADGSYHHPKTGAKLHVHDPDKHLYTDRHAGYTLHTKSGKKVEPEPKTHHGKLAKHLTAKGYHHEENHHHDTRRYTQRTHGTDDWNAHQTKVHTAVHTHSIKDPDKAHKKELHKHLINEGYSHSKSTYTTKHSGKPIKHESDHYYKGKHHVHVTRKGKSPITNVHHTQESTKPDHEFERSGRGHGQII